MSEKAHQLKTVISLGGSLIVPDSVDSVFLKKFRALILSYISKRQFFIITGGGRTARHYQHHISKVVPLSQDDLHWMGIHSTRLNAQLLRLMFGKAAHSEILYRPEHKEVITRPIVIGGGTRPGGTSDHATVVFAHSYGVKEIINLSNVDMLYTRDPKKYQNAKPIHRISWKEFRKMFSSTLTPGFQGPFDPVASRLAQKHNLKVVLLNGKNLKNLKNYFDGKKFVGTVIS